MNVKKIVNKKTPEVIDHFNMDVNQSTVNIQIRIVGLISKNYKVEINNNNLNIAALIWKKSNDWTKGYFSSISSVFVLPCQVKPSSVKSNLIKDVLHIELQRDIVEDYSLGFNNSDNYRNQKKKTDGLVSVSYSN